MISILRKSFYKNGYLLIIAAWLYTISFIFSNYGAYSSSPERIQKRAEDYLERNFKDFEAFTADTVLLNQVLRRGAVPVYAPQYLQRNAGLFLFSLEQDGPVLNYWSNNKMLPDEKDLSKPDGKQFLSHTNGYFVFEKRTFVYRDKKFIAATLIPIFWNYQLNPKYLPRQFMFDDNIASRYEIATGKADIYVKAGGRNLFGLREKQDAVDDSPGAVSLTLRVIALIFLFIFLNALAFDIAQQWGWSRGFLFLLGAILFLRTLSYLFPFPFNFRSLKLFDSLIYASNWLHPSLGDLLINVLLMFWLVSFAKFAGIKRMQQVKPVKGAQGWLLTGAASVALLTISFASASIIRSLIRDSKISFDVTNFFSLDVYSLISFIILCFIILAFFHLSHIVLLFIYKCVSVPAYARYVLLAVMGLIYLSFRLSNTAAISNLAVLVWLLGYMLLLEFRKEDLLLPVLRSSYFLIWVIFFAASISGLIIYENSALNMQQRKKEAESIASNANPNAQDAFFLGIASIDTNFLATNFERFRNNKSSQQIKDSFTTAYTSESSGFFDARIYTFDEYLNPLNNDDSTSYNDLQNIIRRGKKTSAANVISYEKEVNNYSYIYEQKLSDANGNARGYFYIVADAKKNKQGVYPVLFKQQDAAEYADPYAVYSNEQLVMSSGNYEFASKVTFPAYPRNIYEEIVNGDVSELWYNAGGGKLVITVRKISVFFEFVTLFAYLFVALLLIVMVIRAGQLLIKYRFRLRTFRTGVQFNIRHQIQAAIIFLSIFSFLVIGFSTIAFYRKRFDETNREKLVRSIRTFSKEIEAQIASHNLGDDVVKLYEPGAKSMLERTLQQVSEVQGTDANIYDAQGYLRATTQPQIYRTEVFTRMMDPDAYEALQFHDKTLLIHNESIGHFGFKSVYAPVKDENGNTYAYLNTPYLNTQIELNQEISSFLVTLINLNAFIFVIAGAISVLITNRITNSFTLIGSKMQDINLGKANEEIEWSTNDEIGALVNEYNKMVGKLGESAAALAKSEREGAWREMARQVAHEIKNPLTPMKLSLQYLQRAIQEKNPDMQEMTRKVATTLVEQIDQLAKIASDFSQFANIGNVKTEVFDVNELLESLINMYSTNEKLKITFNKAQQHAQLNADKSQVNRLFTNLFQNAIEASDGKPAVPIIIEEEITGKNLLIHFSDKGSGIPAETRDKIFTPNFTTKSSGTGLGLAISKSIVENANGKIWFDTEEGKGTTFHILLPLV